MKKYPTQYRIKDNAMAVHSSNDKEVYGIQQKATQHSNFL